MPTLSDRERRDQAIYRGGSGYKELRIALLEMLAKASGDVGKAADQLLKADE